MTRYMNPRSWFLARVYAPLLKRARNWTYTKESDEHSDRWEPPDLRNRLLAVFALSDLVVRTVTLGRVRPTCYGDFFLLTDFSRYGVLSSWGRIDGGGVEAAVLAARDRHDNGTGTWEAWEKLNDAYAEWVFANHKHPGLRVDPNGAFYPPPFLAWGDEPSRRPTPPGWNSLLSAVVLLLFGAWPRVERVGYRLLFVLGVLAALWATVALVVGSWVMFNFLRVVGA